MHLFHKWEVISNRRGEAVFNGLSYLFRPTNEQVIITIESCKKCGKKRAYAKKLDGEKYKVDPDFLLPL